LLMFKKSSNFSYSSQSFPQAIYFSFSYWNVRYVWPWAQNISIGYLCKRHPYTKAFPTQRKNERYNFVGSIIAKDNKILTAHKIWQECPLECRPDNQKDWKYC
jgi:hypothetical protein